MKKSQGRDTSDQGSMVYPGLAARLGMGGGLLLSAAPTPLWGWSLTLANTALM